MLPVDADTIRLFLHVLGATVWVGGQLTLAALVPTVRSFGEGAAATVARRFDRVAWPAFGLLLVTGIWNLVEIDVTETSTEYQVTLAAKLLAVAVSGGGAAVHRGAKTTLVLAVAGAVGAVGAVAALFLGVMVHG